MIGMKVIQFRRGFARFPGRLVISMGLLCAVASSCMQSTKVAQPERAVGGVCADADGPLFPFPATMEENRFESECGKALFNKPRIAWGYMTQSGCVAIEPQFGSAEAFSKEGLAVAGREVIIEQEARWGIGFHYGAINRSGEWVVEPKYLALSSFEAGVATGIFSETREDWAFPKKVGVYVSSTGEHLGDAGCGVMVNGAQLNKCKQISEGLVFRKPQLTMAQWKEILSPEAYAAAEKEAAKFLDILQTDVTFSSSRTPGRYTDAQGNVMIEQWFSEGCPFREGVACVRPLGGGKMGYIDRQGTEVLPFEYTSASSFEEGIAKVYKDGKRTFIDGAGNTVLVTKHSVFGGFHDGRAVVSERVEGKVVYGFIDQTGTFVIPAQFARAGDFADGVAAVHAGRKYGRDQWRFIDAAGNVPAGLAEKQFASLSTPRFDRGLVLLQELSLAEEGTHWVMVDGKMEEQPGSIVEKWGYVNLAGDWVLGPLDVNWNAPAGFMYNGASFCKRRLEAQQDK